MKTFAGGRLVRHHDFRGAGLVFGDGLGAVTPHSSANDLYARPAGKASLVNPRADWAGNGAAKLNERRQKERTAGLMPAPGERVEFRPPSTG